MGSHGRCVLLFSVFRISHSGSMCCTYTKELFPLCKIWKALKSKTPILKEITYISFRNNWVHGETYFQTIAFSEALYLAFPLRQMSWTPDVLRGVGIFTSIFCPKRLGLKLDLRTTFTSILVRPTSRTKGITRNGNEMSFVVRYLEFQSSMSIYYHIIKGILNSIFALLF